MADARAKAAGQSGLKRIIANTAWLFAGKGFGGFLSLFYLAIVTRTLGVVGFGEFALIVGTAQAIVLFVSFQTWQVIVRYSTAHDVEQADSGILGGMIGLCTVFEVVGAAIGVGIAWAVTYYFAPAFGWTDAVAEQAFAFAAVILVSIKSTPTGLLRVTNRFDLTTYAEAVVPMTRMAGALFVWLTEPSIAGFLFVWALGEVLSALVCWTLAIIQVRGAVRFAYLRHIGAAWRRHDGIGGFLFICNAGSTLTGFAQNIGLVVIGLYVGPVAAGLYRIASQLSSAMAKVSTLLSRAIFAEVNWAKADGGKDAMRDLYGRANRLLYITGAVVMAIIVLAGKPVLVAMSGAEYGAAYPVLVLLGVAAVINLIGAMNEPTLLSGEGAAKALGLQALAAAAYAGLLALLLSFYGMIGAGGAMIGFALIRQILLSRAAKAHLAED